MSTPTYTENEIKLYVPDLAPVIARLAELGATLTVPRVYERNVRYDTPDAALRARAAILRLRQDTRVRLTYKDEALPDESAQIGKRRFEAETEVADFDAMQTIIRKLGYQPTQVYEKYRTTYTYADAEITLDEMPFGNFVEIEGTDNAIRTVMNRFGLSDALRFKVSYILLFEWVKTSMQLPFDDLTFDNFKGITVPLSAFERPDLPQPTAPNNKGKSV